MNMQMAFVGWLNAAMLAGVIVALNNRTPVSAPRLAVFVASTSATCIRWVVLPLDVIGAAFNRAIEKAILFGNGREHAQRFPAAGALNINLNFGKFLSPFTCAFQIAIDVLALFFGWQEVKLLPAIFTRKQFDCVGGSFGVCMLAAAKNIVRAKSFNSPSFNLNWLTAICTGTFNQIVDAKFAWLGFVTFAVLGEYTITTRLDNLTASTFAPSLNLPVHMFTIIS